MSRSNSSYTSSRAENESSSKQEIQETKETTKEVIQDSKEKILEQKEIISEDVLRDRKKQELLDKGFTEEDLTTLTEEEISRIIFIDIPPDFFDDGSSLGDMYGMMFENNPDSIPDKVSEELRTHAATNA